MNRYTLEIPVDGTTDLTFTAAIGTHTATIRCLWAIASNEQYNLLMQKIREEAQRDPLLSKDRKGIRRDYDWVAFYNNIKYDDLVEWLATAEWIPQSLTPLSQAQAILVLQQRIAVARSTDGLLLLYSEMMRWQFTFNSDAGIITGFIQPGGWYMWQDRSFAFRFVSDRECIWKDDLAYVTMEFEVYDE